MFGMGKHGYCCSNGNINVSYENTDTGIIVKLEPTDSSKVKAFQDMIAGHKEFCCQKEDCC